MLDACVEVESYPEQVESVRAFALAALAQWELEGMSDDALLVVSELATNVVMHARTPMRVTLHSDGLSFIRIEVHDDNPRQPILAPPPVDATSGRGLPLVTAIAQSWGVRAEPCGKTVWAELRDSSLRTFEDRPLPIIPPATLACP